MEVDLAINVKTSQAKKRCGRPVIHDPEQAVPAPPDGGIREENSHHKTSQAHVCYSMMDSHSNEPNRPAKKYVSQF